MYLNVVEEDAPALAEMINTINRIPEIYAVWETRPSAYLKIVSIILAAAFEEKPLDED